MTEAFPPITLQPDAKLSSTDKSFRLDEGTTAFVIAQGSINLFAALLEADMPPSGARRYALGRFEAGDMLFGSTHNHNRETGLQPVLFAVPTPGTLLETVPYDAASSFGERETGVVINGIVKWSETLLSMCRAPVPEDCRTFTPGDRIEEKQSIHGASQGTLAWLTAPANGLHYFGTDWISFEDTATIPVTQRMWVRIDGPVAAPIAAADAPLQSGALADCIARFNAVALGHIRQAIERLGTQEKGMRRSAAEQRQARAKSGLQTLAGVLQTASTMPFECDNPVAASVARIAAALGATSDAPEHIAREISHFGFNARLMCESLSIRARDVTLDPDWWRKDSGPLVVFVGENRDVAAAIYQRSNNSYVLIDGTTGTCRKLSPHLSDDIHADGFHFTVGLPEQIRSLRQFIGFGLHQVGRDLGVLAAAILLLGNLSITTPIAAGWVIGFIVPEARLEQLAIVMVLLVSIALISACIGLAQTLSVLRIEGGMDARLQPALWDRLLKLPANFFRNYSVGDLASRVEGVETIRKTLSGSVILGVLSATVGLFSLAVMLYFNWRLALCISGFMIVVALAINMVGRRAIAYQRDILDRRGRLSGMVFQFLSGLLKIRVAGSEETVFSQWAHDFAVIERQSFRQHLLMAFNQVFSEAMPVASFLVLVLAITILTGNLFTYFDLPYSWTAIDTARIDAVFKDSSFLAFFAAMGQFVSATMLVERSALKIMSVGPAFERLRPIVEAKTETSDGTDDPGRLYGGIEMKGIRFRYDADGPVILKKLDLTIEPGQFVAVVGPSGAGKSTVMRLLLGFDKPEAGSIFLDGQDMRTLDIRAVRRNFGVVLQNAQILAGTIFQNIIVGEHLSEKDAWAAARAAGLEEDIRRMPMKMHTVVNEGATTLSGGQRQRLMIARAIVRKPSILMFDEATSALDNKTQAVVSESLSSLTCTRIVIAHRLSTIREADRIIVINNGGVEESGTYEELMQAGGTFADLAKRQIA
ncbi:NHLP bacteriocin export ABC transporter permease/ATPase subunit [Nisaea sp.]|uniref:NHLP bacteriocin export ABC transporter permease/ATPase subunit n=1 Tax=Nisaea sp. TaxID=2024842 RepID=UPI0032EBC49B